MVDFPTPSHEFKGAEVFASFGVNYLFAEAYTRKFIFDVIPSRLPTFKTTR